MLHFIHDIAVAYDGPDAFYDGATRRQNLEFASSFFGTAKVTVSAAEAAFAPLGLKACGIVDRFLGAHTKGRAVGWLVLQKPGPR